MYEVDQNRDAYREGLFARALGHPCGGNPYPEHSREASLWIHGWWLIQDAADESEPPPLFQFDDVSANFLPESKAQPIRSLWIHAVEAMRSLLVGLLLAVTGFSLSYAALRIFLL